MMRVVQQHRSDQPRSSSSSPARTALVHHDSSRENIIVASVNNAAKHGAHAIVARHPDDNERPAKKRKLSIRTQPANHKQQTSLHHHFQPLQRSSKPPSTRVTVQEPHGRLLQTINGVQTALDTGEDDLLNSSPKPRRATRSPLPTHPTPPPPAAQPRAARPAKQEEKRSLRSHDDGPRLKSELAIYFPSYEDIIFDAAQPDADFLTVDTTLYITDDAAAKPSKGDTPVKTSKAPARRTSVNGQMHSSLTPQRSSSSQFNGSPALNLDFVAKTIPDDADDPLTDAHFLKSHKRAERKEKQLRNIEKERAMHEKVQLERILDGLLGHDWLRVLGITGITDTEAKKYEGKRNYFIAEVQALVDKFKQWKEEEKRQRLDKEAAAAAREAEEEDGNTSEGSTEPPSSDLNASAARQLQQETANALKLQARAANKGKERAHPVAPRSYPSQPGTPTAPPRQMLPPQPPSPDIPFTSFYSKRHLRDAALSRSRHGRNVTAFGQPLPEMDEQTFQLPGEYVTEDALRANARERRRRKRESTTASSANASS